jgi:hypothetical protein
MFGNDLTIHSPIIKQLKNINHSKTLIMKKQKILLFSVILVIGILSRQSLSAQVQTDCYTVRSGDSETILIENGQLYRLTIKSCWYSADACLGTYLVYGLNASDPKTNGQPSILVVAQSPRIDWRFSFSLSGQYDNNMRITSQGWGDQGLLVVVERLSNRMYQNSPNERNYRH